MGHGNDHSKKKFVVFPRKPSIDTKKCFKDDCRNEGESCGTCMMLQGKWINYQQERNIGV